MLHRVQIRWIYSCIYIFIYVFDLNSGKLLGWVFKVLIVLFNLIAIPKLSIQFWFWFQFDFVMISKLSIQHHLALILIHFTSCSVDSESDSNFSLISSSYNWSVLFDLNLIQFRITASRFDSYSDLHLILIHWF